MNSSRETLKGGFACPECCWNATKGSNFCIGLLLVIKNGLIRLKRAIAEKCPEYATRHEAIIFHYDNARPHVAIPAKNYLENSG